VEYRPLGRTGISVSELCLGAMMFGAAGNPDHDESIRIIHRALDAGINMIDTADVYSFGESEEIVGKALAGGLRDDVVLATKVGLPWDDRPGRGGTSRRWITRSVEASLRRLGTDRIDLYQIHRLDPATDLEETLGALTDLRAQGKIRAFGASTVPASGIVEAQWVAQRRGLGRFRTEQPPYNILTREIESDVLPTAQRYGMGVLTYSPLAMGWLTGRYRAGMQAPDSGRAHVFPGRFDPALPANRRKLEATEALAVLADESGLSLIEMAIAFVLRHPAVTSAIIGPRTMDHLESQLPAADVRLSTEVLDRIDEIVLPGVTLNPEADNMSFSTALEPANRRR